MKLEQHQLKKKKNWNAWHLKSQKLSKFISMVLVNFDV